jgi:hypothetical protein
LLVDGARKELVPSGMTSPLGTPRGRCDEYSSKIFPQLRNQGMSIRRGADNTTEGDANWLNNTPTRAPFTTLVDSSSASSNAEPAHTQPSTLFPTYDEVVNLTGLLETNGMSVTSGKQ